MAQNARLGDAHNVQYKVFECRDRSGIPTSRDLNFVQIVLTYSKLSHKIIQEGLAVEIFF